MENGKWIFLLIKNFCFLCLLCPYVPFYRACRESAEGAGDVTAYGDDVAEGDE